MSVSEQIIRIQDDRNIIRTKLVGWGIAQSSDDLDSLATKLNNVVNRGTPQVTVQVGDSYSIQPGYYTGGSVTGIAGEGQYTLQTKTVTPTMSQQVIQPDTGYYGLSQVTVNSIPSNYADVSSVDAIAANVLATKKFVTSTGVLTAGTMTNNGAVSATIDATTTSYTIPSGYHNGSGIVSLITETKTVTPSGASQDIIPTSGKVLSKVVVQAISDRYIDSFDTDEYDSSKILVGTKVGMYDDVHISGTIVEGTMPNNGSISGTITGLGTVTGDTSYTIPSGYTSGGTISLTNDIETQLAAI